MSDVTDGQLFDMFAAPGTTTAEVAALSDSDLKRQVAELMVMWEIDADEYGTANEIAACIRQYCNESLQAQDA